jgi:hypothetical protein
MAQKMINGITIGKMVEIEDIHSSIPVSILLGNGWIGELGGKLIININRITLSSGDTLWGMMRIWRVNDDQ